MNRLLVFLILLYGIVTTSASARVKVEPKSPEKGVICDIYFCADYKGISIELTSKYLGRATSQKLSGQGDFDHYVFTFTNGIFCDTHEKLCRKDRYFGLDGKRSGVIDKKYTSILFDAH